MSDDKSASVSRPFVGVGFFGLLAIVFITLKLCNVIEWDWWLVLSPLWGKCCCFLPVIIIAVIVAAAKTR